MVDNENPEKPDEEKAEGNTAVVEVLEDLETDEIAIEEPAPVVQEAPKSGSLITLLAGGVLAGAIGFAIAYFGDEFFRREDPAIGEFAQRLEVVDTELAQIREEAASTKTALDLQAETQSKLSDVIVATQTNIDELSGELSALKSLEQRLVDLENRPIPDVGATQESVAAYERELTAMREMFAAELARIEERQEQVSAIQQTAVEASQEGAFQTAKFEISRAFEDGRPMQPYLSGLADLGVEIPAILEQHSSAAPNLVELQANFPDAAREAIDLDYERQAASGEMGRFEAFIKSQFSARSLTPGEGDDANAVLSRAEAALRGGNVAGSLKEIAAHGNLKSSKLASWIAAATTFQDIKDAISQLGANVN